jgi:hypothetical protein
MENLYSVLMNFIFINSNENGDPGDPILISMYLGIVLGLIFKSVKEIYLLCKNKQFKFLQWLLCFIFMFAGLKYFFYIQRFNAIANYLFIGSFALITSILVYMIVNLIIEHQESYSKYEKGTDIPSGINLLKLSNIFSVSPKYLCNDRLEIDPQKNLEKALTDLKESLSIVKKQISSIETALDIIIMSYKK